MYAGPDLRTTVQAAQLAGPTATPDPTAVTTASQHPEVANLQAKNNRLTRHLSTLKRRLLDMLSEQVYRTSGVGTSDETAQLRRHQGELTQRVLDLQQHLDDRIDELTVARAANPRAMASCRARLRTLNERGRLVKQDQRWPDARCSRGGAPRVLGGVVRKDVTRCGRGR